MTPASGSRLLSSVRAAVRGKHYSARTEKAYTGGVHRYVRFHRCRHPSGMAEPDVVAYLRHLVVDRKVGASTHNPALSALFLY